MKKIVILGSTGSIGTNALDVLSQHPDRFAVVALAAGRNIARLSEQIRRYHPPLVSVADREDAQRLEQELRADSRHPVPKILWGEEGAVAAATVSDADIVLSAFVGAAGLVPTLSALKAKKTVALANKEALVVAGEFMIATAKRYRAPLLPVDSEHSAIFQCLQGNETRAVSRILLTASGGPFRTRPIESFADITLDEALAHPNWKMGPKITIDSATMMNKGLELIEARWFFDQPVERIEVHIHPESVIHSMVAFWDGSVMAQLGVPDMRGPIAYALSYPERLPLSVPALDLFAAQKLTFYRPERERFPALYLAMEAARLGGTAPAVLNAANEVANAAFREGRLAFVGISSLIETVLNRAVQAAQIHSIDALETVLSVDAWARKTAEALL